MKSPSVELLKKYIKIEGGERTLPYIKNYTCHEILKLENENYGNCLNLKKGNIKYFATVISKYLEHKIGWQMLL